jgi:hypothetical protein
MRYAACVEYMQVPISVVGRRRSIDVRTAAEVVEEALQSRANRAAHNYGRPHR